MTIREDMIEMKKDVEEIKTQGFAFEILSDYKKANKRIFIALIIVLVMWFITLGYLVYVLNDVGTIETTTEVQQSDADNNKDYCPENCRWSTPKFQSNHKTNNVLYTFKGETKTAKQWCEEYGISQTTFNDRLKRGWTLEQALTIPTKGLHQKVFKEAS